MLNIGKTQHKWSAQTEYINCSKFPCLKIVLTLFAYISSSLLMNSLGDNNSYEIKAVF